MAVPPNSSASSSSASPDGTPDPSMEDILASIRRILNEDEVPKSAPEPAFPAEPKPGVRVLDASMMVPETPVRDTVAARDPEPAPREERAPDPEPAASVTALAPFALVAPVETAVPPAASDKSAGQPLMAQAKAASQPGMALVAPEAAAAAGASVDALMRTLANERNTAVQRGGPTIEDLVRAEIRPLLKDWLDNHLPPLVERLVRSEIERVVSRMTP